MLWSFEYNNGEFPPFTVTYQEIGGELFNYQTSKELVDIVKQCYTEEDYNSFPVAAWKEYKSYDKFVERQADKLHGEIMERIEHERS